MSEIPKPTEADLARDAVLDLPECSDERVRPPVWRQAPALCREITAAWIRRAHAAEADVKRLRGELVALSPLCEQLRDAKERAEAAAEKVKQLEKQIRLMQERTSQVL